MTTVGEYIPLVWESDSGPEFEVVRGHVDADVARDELRRWGHDPADYGDPQQRWARWVFADHLACFDRELRFCERGRGAFAVTVFWPRMA